jgi:hypothetical protein
MREHNLPAGCAALIWTRRYIAIQPGLSRGTRKAIKKMARAGEPRFILFAEL